MGSPSAEQFSSSHPAAGMSAARSASLLTLRLGYSALRHLALRAVCELRVVVRMESADQAGYLWQDGGQVPETWHDALNDLSLADMIAFRRYPDEHGHDRPLHLTMRGKLQLMEWDLGTMPEEDSLDEPAVTVPISRRSSTPRSERAS